MPGPALTAFLWSAGYSAGRAVRVLLVRPSWARNAGSRGRVRLGTLLGPEGTGALRGGGWSSRGPAFPLCPPFFRGVGAGGRARPFLENCTVDASIYPGSSRAAG